jgi:hypothetical protein
MYLNFIFTPSIIPRPNEFGSADIRSKYRSAIETPLFSMVKERQKMSNELFKV